jgi:AraC-like DNA-binding protein
MEIIDVLIFAQSMVWGTALYKNQGNRQSPLTLSFTTIGFIFIARYLTSIEALDSLQLIIMGFPAVALAFIFQFLLNRPSLIVKKLKYPIAIIFIVVSAAVLLLVIFSSLSNNFYWGFLIGISTILSGYSWIKWIIKKRIKEYTGKWFEDPVIRLNMLVLSSLSILIVSSFSVLISSGYGDPDNAIAMNIFLILLAIILFITGYTSLVPGSIIQSKDRERRKSESDSGVPRLITELMEKEKPYLDCELTLGKMADMLEIDEHELTRILNEEMNVNFYGLINKYRIETVKAKLNEPSNRNFTIMASAYESGFNSKSTFYRIFKEYTGITPKEYLAKLKPAPRLRSGTGQL